MMDFIRDFLKYVDKVGIFDEYDKDTNKMKTSSGVEALIKQARQLMPEELSGREAGLRMTELSEAHRDALIKAAGPRVVDLRTEFAKKMAMNGGAHKLLTDIVEAVHCGDDINELIETADTFVHANEDETFEGSS